VSDFDPTRFRLRVADMPDGTVWVSVLCRACSPGREVADVNDRADTITVAFLRMWMWSHWDGEHRG
jgi:hypothetical protein